MWWFLIFKMVYFNVRSINSSVLIFAQIFHLREKELWVGLSVQEHSTDKRQVPLLLMFKKVILTRMYAPHPPIARETSTTTHLRDPTDSPMSSIVAIVLLSPFSSFFFFCTPVCVHACEGVELRSLILSFFFLFKATPVAYEISWAKGQPKLYLHWIQTTSVIYAAACNIMEDP